MWHVVIVVHTLSGHIIEAKYIYSKKPPPHLSQSIMQKWGHIFEKV